MREGSLEAPTRHPLDWKNPEFYDEAVALKEVERIFDICHGCRRCVNLCNAFPTLFDLVDASKTMEVDGVAKGEFAVGMTMEYAAQEYVAGGNKDIEVVYPTEGTYIAPEGMALVKNSPNPTEARKFYDFLSSRQAQEMLVKKFFRRPIRDDVDTTAVGLPRTSNFKAAAIDHLKAQADQPSFIKSWKELVAAK